MQAAGQAGLTASSLVQFEVAEQRLILPDTSFDIAWVDGRIDAIGPMSCARASSYTDGTQVVLLSIAPSIASDWLGVPLAELSDRIVPLSEIHPENAKRLAMLFEDGSVSRLVRPRLPDHSRLAKAVSALTAGATVAQVAENVNLCSRQFTRSFQRTMGLHPKRFQRILRLRRAIVLAKSGLPLAAAAIDAGYADQAHFTREVRALTGAAPLKVLPNVGNVQDVVIEA